MRTQPAGCKRCRGISHLRVHVEREIGCVHTKYVDYIYIRAETILRVTRVTVRRSALSFCYFPAHRKSKVYVMLIYLLLLCCDS